jgi:transposase-like protein
MAYYNYKELRDALPPEMVDKWAEEDGSADYDSTLWSYGADYIAQLKKERDEARREAEIERDRTCHPDHGGHLFSWENANVQRPADAAPNPVK